MSDQHRTATIEASRSHLENAENTADRYAPSKLARAAVGAGFALLALAEAATRIADAYESARDRGAR